MKLSFARTTLAFTACLLLGSSMAFAQATRTWVSGVGDDANPCSRTAPCKTFAGAISKTAAGGEIDALDPGGFGAVTITKAITISGAGTLASVLVSGTNAIIISAGVNDVVTLQDLSLQGLGTGITAISMNAGKALVIDNVRVMGFQNAVKTVQGNTSINRSSFTNNSNIALWATSTSNLAVENSVINQNNVAVQPDLGSNIRLANNAVYDNRTGFACGTGGTLSSAGNNRKANNTGGVIATCTPTIVITLQ
jgi:hypothetical protein